MNIQALTLTRVETLEPRHTTRPLFLPSSGKKEKGGEGRGTTPRHPKGLHHRVDGDHRGLEPLEDEAGLEPEVLPRRSPSTVGGTVEVGPGETVEETLDGEWTVEGPVVPRTTPTRSPTITAYSD